MAIITNNNFNRLDLRVSKSDYWDFILSKESDPAVTYTGGTLYDENLISYINFESPETYAGDSKVYSLSGYTWAGSQNYTQNLNLPNIGFTGIDNGLITGATLDHITGSTLTRTGDTRLVLNIVTGNTGQLQYPISFVVDSHDDYIKLEGGFYQGFFKSGDDYAILPDKIADEMTFEVVLRPSLPFITASNTLNGKYPNNRGFFLYLGTRAENKFWYEYLKEDTDKYPISKTGQTSPIISGTTLITSDGLNIEAQNTFEIETDNKYLLFNRTIDGFTTDNFPTDTTYYVTGVSEENLNLYQYFNRTSTGYTTNNVQDLPGLYNPYEVVQDVTNNAIGFRLKEDSLTGNTCSIGYRYITSTCDENIDYIVEEEYSNPGVINNHQLAFIAIRLVYNAYDPCSNGGRKFKIYFYVNGSLVLVSKELPELNLRKLNDTDEKQEGVAYNISLGGGTQGLADMIGFNTGYTTQYLLPIEKNFAGTFIGEIYKFRIHDGVMDYTKIKNNYIYDRDFMPEHVSPTIIFTVTGMTTFPETLIKREVGNTTSYLDLTTILNQATYPFTNYEVNYYKDLDGKIQIIGGDLNPAGGVVLQSYQHRAIGATNVKYEVIVRDTYATTQPANISIINIEFDKMIFFGATDEIPAQSSDIRNLTGKTFNSETNTIVFNTGTEKIIFAFAMPVGRTITKVMDVGDYNFNITSALDPVRVVTVLDGENNPMDYNVYTIVNAIPYSSNHQYIITLN